MFWHGSDLLAISGDGLLLTAIATATVAQMDRRMS
jgi:hypothetical protein